MTPHQLLHVFFILSKNWSSKNTGCFLHLEWEWSHSWGDWRGLEWFGD
jgi:hypothetical protein